MGFALDARLHIMLIVASTDLARMRPVLGATVRPPQDPEPCVSAATRAFLVLHAGSSGLKFGLCAAADLAALCRGEIEAIGADATFKVEGCRDAFDKAPPLPRRGGPVTSWLAAAHAADLSARQPGGRSRSPRGHRGMMLGRPVVIDDAAMAALADLVPLAPAHQPHNFPRIRAVEAAWPGLPQPALLRHRVPLRAAPACAAVRPPRSLSEQGMVRYSFRGLSYEYVAGCISEKAGIGPDQRIWWRISATAPACAPCAPDAALPPRSDSSR